VAKDPYKFFRLEARELLEGLSQCVLEIEKGSRDKDLVGRILRLAHTLKGASRVVRQTEVADLAHSIEDVFAPFREEQGEILQGQINQVLRSLDTMASLVASLVSESAETKRETPRPASEDFFATVRVEIEEVDTLLRGVAEASVQLIALRREYETLKRACLLAGRVLESVTHWETGQAGGSGRTDGNANTLTLADELHNHLERLERRLPAGIDQVAAEFAQVRDASNRLRLLPSATIFAALERSVRDAAQTLQKEVLFESFGSDMRLDARVLAGLRDALLHVVRNAVAHGIESPPERRVACKPAQGRVELRVERRGNRVAFVCRDDGRGIDVEAIRRTAVRRGLVQSSEAASLGLEEAVRIILKGGVTTTGSVDEISGRGIGLDVVREIAARLKGEVTVRSEAGKGTSLEICVPVSVSSLTALEMNAGGTVASVPLDAVRETLRVVDCDIVHSAGKDSVVYDGSAIPFLALKKALTNKTVADRKSRSWSVVVVEGPCGMAAIGVDRLLGVTSIVLRSLPELSEADPIVAGASLDAEGNPQLVLNPEGLVAAACVGTAPGLEPVSGRRPPVLVIDDSLTTRMLEQNILESAGYEVDLATSAEEALGKARQKQYGLFLVDVEMPGMDGFEFVSHTQTDAALRSVPSILVTSRNAPEDRRRGEQVGARAYIVKGDFDQGFLLQRIREFVG